MKTEAKRKTAAEVVAEHLAACLVPGMPPSHRAIRRAYLQGKGRNWRAIAELEMFDGKTATVEVFERPSGGYGHRWIEMPGGDVYFEAGQWRRKNPES